MSEFRITDIRVKLTPPAAEDKLIGYCTLTVNDAIVIKDIKVIHSEAGPFVAMPSRKLTSHCHQCRGKNHLRAAYCNDCGTKLNHKSRGDTTRERLHFDVVHPINAEIRAMVHDAIMREIELQRRNGSSAADCAEMEG